mgnify:CR=1 FL=1
MPTAGIKVLELDFGFFEVVVKSSGCSDCSSRGLLFGLEPMAEIALVAKVETGAEAEMEAETEALPDVAAAATVAATAAAAAAALTATVAAASCHSSISSCGRFEANLSVALRKDILVAAHMAVGGFGPILIPFAAAAAAS